MIRQAVLADLNRVDLDQLRLDPPQENMWRDWSDTVNVNNGGYSAAFARGQGINA